MFSHAISIATQYTRPVIVCKRLLNKQVSSGVASFIVLNDEGWILTAAPLTWLAFLVDPLMASCLGVYGRY
jgi:hypothetical protein